MHNRINDSGVVFIFAFFVSVVFLLIENSFSSVIFLLILLILVISITRKLLYATIFLVGCLFALCVENYWGYFFDSPYFLGRYSDDFQYSSYWSKGYFEAYGISPFGITEYLNSIEPNLGYLHNSKGYVYFVTLHYAFGYLFDGYSMLLPKLTNVAVWTFTVFLLDKCVAASTKLNTPRLFVLFSFFYPTMIFTVVHVFRDTIISFLLVATVHLVIRNDLKIIWKGFWISSIIAVLLTFRLQVALVIIIWLIIAFLLVDRSGNLKNRKYIPPLFVIVCGAVYLLLIDNEQLIIRTLSTYNELNQERLGSIGNAIFAAPIGLSIPARLAYLILIPTPALAPAYQLFLSLSAYIQVFFLPAVLASLVNRHIDLRIRTFVLLMFFTVSLSSATFRHTMMYLPITLLMVQLHFKTAPNSLRLFTGLYMLKVIFLLILMLAFISFAVFL